MKRRIKFLSLICLVSILLASCMPQIHTNNQHEFTPTPQETFIDPNPNNYPAIDIVSPLSEYFVYENASGYGTIASLGYWDDVEDERIQVGDLYFHFLRGGNVTFESNALQVIKNNKIAGRIYFDYSKNKNLKSGETITVIPKFYKEKTFEDSFEYFFTPIEITVPDLGEYITLSTFTRTTFDTLEPSLISSYERTKGYEICFICFCEILPGEINSLNSPVCLIVVKGALDTSGTKMIYQAEIIYDVICDRYGGVISYTDSTYINTGYPQSTYYTDYEGLRQFISRVEEKYSVGLLTFRDELK